MNITEAKYQLKDKDVEDGMDNYILTTIDGKKLSVPPSERNADYAEILKQVKEGTLTIKEAE